MWAIVGQVRYQRKHKIGPSTLRVYHLVYTSNSRFLGIKPVINPILHLIHSQPCLGDLATVYQWSDLRQPILGYAGHPTYRTV
jgi:hypothetical protein